MVEIASGEMRMRPGVPDSSVIGGVSRNARRNRRERKSVVSFAGSHHDRNEKGSPGNGKVRELRQDHDLRAQPKLLDEGHPAEVRAEPSARANPRRATAGAEDAVRQVHQAAGARLAILSSRPTLAGPPKGGPVSQTRAGDGCSTRRKASTPA